MNIQPVDIDKHTSGIDVSGIRIIGDDIKFVVCEVKASGSKTIPCSSMAGLNDDIQKSIDNKDNRLTKEILQYMCGIKKIKVQDKELLNIVEFLARLITSSEKDLVDSILFFLLVIRCNETIINSKNVNDYKKFEVNGIEHNQIENIIGAIKYDIEEFSNKVYEEVVGHE